MEYSGFYMGDCQMFDKNFKCQATYFGGHFLHPAPPNNGDIGNFILTSEKIIFEKIALFSSNRWAIEIPMNKILWEKVAQETGDDLTYKAKMAAAAYFATGKPVSTFSRNTTYLTIPYVDEKGMEQKPKFTFNKPKDLEEISKFFYEKMPAKK